MRCPDERCRWFCVGSPDRAAEMLELHLAVDARHTNGAWIDENGCERVGFQYLSQQERRMQG
jgi:hypothetical protein